MTIHPTSADPLGVASDHNRRHDQSILCRRPTCADARGMHELVQRSGGLDCNSRYAYLLLADHFAPTCVVAERAGRIVGVTTAYLKPSEQDTLFVWQVAVDPTCRGQGVARKMLRALLLGPACRNVRAIETTVGPSNAASHAMFASLARSLGAAIDEQPGYRPEQFSPDVHEAEALLRLSPVDPRALSLS